MRKEIHISIPEPCHEDWNKMTQEEKGRHCKVCEKTVFDFTDKTDEYIVKSLEKNNNLCGRFKNQQLNRPVVYSRKERNNLMSYAASGVLAFLALGTNNVEAQGNTQVIQTERPITVLGKVAHPVLKKRVISGTIIGIDSKKLEGVTIQEKGLKNSVITDRNGCYTIKANKGATLVFSFQDYETFEIEIQNSNHVSLEMVKKTDNQLLTIIGVITDEDGLPLPSATVIEKGTTNGVSSDFDGNYEIQVKPEAIIQFQYVGYNDKEIKALKIKDSIISLEPDSELESIYVGAFRIRKNEVRKNTRQEKRAKIRKGEIERTSVGKFFHKINIFRKKKQE